MNAAGDSPPTLRCLSCCYNVASIIAQRGRDGPGVCPECGADLGHAVYFSSRPGTAWQQCPHTTPGLVRFNLESLRSPKKVAASVRLPDRLVGNVSVWNSFVAAFFSLLIPTIGALAALSFAKFAEGVVVTLLGCLPLMGVFVVVLRCINATAQLIAAAREWEFNDKLPDAAVDIGSAWMVALPFIAWGCVGLVLIVSPSSMLTPIAALLLASAFACLASLVATIRALDELRSALTTPFRPPLDRAAPPQVSH